MKLSWLSPLHSEISVVFIFPVCPAASACRRGMSGSLWKAARERKGWRILGAHPPTLWQPQAPKDLVPVILFFSNCSWWNWSWFPSFSTTHSWAFWGGLVRSSFLSPSWRSPWCCPPQGERLEQWDGDMGWLCPLKLPLGFHLCVGINPRCISPEMSLYHVWAQLEGPAHWSTNFDNFLMPLFAVGSTKVLAARSDSRTCYWSFLLSFLWFCHVAAQGKAEKVLPTHQAGGPGV